MAPLGSLNRVIARLAAEEASCCNLLVKGFKYMTSHSCDLYLNLKIEKSCGNASVRTTLGGLVCLDMVLIETLDLDSSKADISTT